MVNSKVLQFDQVKQSSKKIEVVVIEVASIDRLNFMFFFFSIPI